MAGEVAIQPLGGLVPHNFNANIDASFIWNVNFSNFSWKVYLFLTTSGEKSEFPTFSEKSDQSPRTVYQRLDILDTY